MEEAGEVESTFDFDAIEGGLLCMRNLDSLEGDTSSMLSLLDLTTGHFTEIGRAAGGPGAEYGTFPTQRHHSKASPRARSQRPISLGSNPVSFTHTQFK